MSGTESPKIALVTGGSRGLGRNVVLSLARRGVDSIFTYHSNEEEAHNAVTEVEALGRRAVALGSMRATFRRSPPSKSRCREPYPTLGPKGSTTW